MAGFLVAVKFGTVRYLNMVGFLLLIHPIRCFYPHYTSSAHRSAVTTADVQRGIFENNGRTLAGLSSRPDIKSAEASREGMDAAERRLTQGGLSVNEALGTAEYPRLSATSIANIQTLRQKLGLSLALDYKVLPTFYPDLLFFATENAEGDARTGEDGSQYFQNNFPTDRTSISRSNGPSPGGYPETQHYLSSRSLWKRDLKTSGIGQSGTSGSSGSSGLGTGLGFPSHSERDTGDRGKLINPGGASATSVDGTKMSGVQSGLTSGGQNAGRLADGSSGSSPHHHLNAPQSLR